MHASGDLIDGRYVVHGLLGRGGMADVFRATDTRCDRTVAVKVMHSAEPASVRRFGAEVDVLGRLDHPCLVRLRGSGTHDGVPYLVLDLALGSSLNRRLDGGALGTDQTVEIGSQVAEALAHAHRRDIVHRDVKPSNILFDETGRACLADFGIARLGGCATITQTGQIIGTASYLSPEQVKGEQVGPDSDIYALGLVLIECLTGCPCYSGGHIEAAVSRLHHSPAIPPDSPLWLRDVLSAMTATDLRRRPSAVAVAEALRRKSAEPVMAITAGYSHDAVAELVDDPRTAVHDAGHAAEISGDSTAATSHAAEPNGTTVRPVGTAPRPQPFRFRTARRLGAVLAALTAVVMVLVVWTAARGETPVDQPLGEPIATSTTTSAAPTTTASPPSFENDGGEPTPAAGGGNGRANGRSNGNGNGNGHGKKND